MRSFLSFPPLPSCSLLISFIRSLVLLPWQQQAHEAETFTAGYIKWRARDGERSSGARERERGGSIIEEERGNEWKRMEKIGSMRREIVRKRDTNYSRRGREGGERKPEWDRSKYIFPPNHKRSPSYLPASIPLSFFKSSPVLAKQRLNAGSTLTKHLHNVPSATGLV